MNTYLIKTKTKDEAEVIVKASDFHIDQHGHLYVGGAAFAAGEWSYIGGLDDEGAATIAKSGRRRVAAFA